MDHLVENYSREAVEAALVGLDDSGDRSDQLAIEAVDALDNLVAVADVKLLTQILAQLLLKIRPCFEKVNNLYFNTSYSLTASIHLYNIRINESLIRKQRKNNNRNPFRRIHHCVLPPFPYLRVWDCEWEKAKISGSHYMQILYQCYCI